jgi:hypothetical protein
VKGNFSTYKSEHALRQLNEWSTQASTPLVQIGAREAALEETRV